jgi:hypothetical protein
MTIAGMLATIEGAAKATIPGGAAMSGRPRSDAPPNRTRIGANAAGQAIASKRRSAGRHRQRVIVVLGLRVVRRLHEARERRRLPLVVAFGETVRRRRIESGFRLEHLVGATDFSIEVVGNCARGDRATAAADRARVRSPGRPSGTAARPAQ